MERVQSMLAHAKLPKTFWVEALSTTTYVINRSPSVPLDGDSPQKVWTGKEESYLHLKVFGCLAYVVEVFLADAYNEAGLRGSWTRERMGKTGTSEMEEINEVEEID